MITRRRRHHRRPERGVRRRDVWATCSLRVCDTVYKMEVSASTEVKAAVSRQGETIPAPAQPSSVCGTCAEKACVQGSYACLECLGSSKVMSRLTQLLKEDNPRITPEEVSIPFERVPAGWTSRSATSELTPLREQTWRLGTFSSESHMQSVVALGTDSAVCTGAAPL